MMEFKYGTYGYIAQKDLVRASKLYEIEEYSAAGFYAQQCLEKICKHYHQVVGVATATKIDFKTHKLRILYANIPLDDIQDAIVAIYSLTDCYYDNRYPGQDYFELTKEASYRYLVATEKIYTKMCEMISSSSYKTKEFL